MDRLKKVRSTIKAKFTRLGTFIDSITDENTPTQEELQNRLEYLETTWEEYDNNHKHIIDQTDDEDDIETEEEDFAEIEAKYFTIKSKLKQLIQLSETASNQNSDNTTNGTVRNLLRGNVKLPRLELPKFSGNILDWTSFHDLFTSMVHNQTISDSQKLHYLKTSVSGEASSLIQAIDVTDANYVEAWRILQDRYQNERKLIQSNLQSLFNQPYLKEESSVSLQKLIDHTTKCVRALHAMGQNTDEWDAMLVFMVTDRMDSDSRRQWELHTPGTMYPELADLKKFIEQRCRALDASSMSKMKTSSNSKINSPKSTTSVHHSTQSSPSTSTCVSCNQLHSLYQCNDFGSMDIKQRSALVRKSNLCFNCLRANHSVKNCLSKSTCRKCGSKHHTMLHQNDSQGNSNQKNDPQVSSHFSDQSSWSSVLLSTAIGHVKDSSGCLQKCRILIDGGSQASFMTENCFTRLGLRRSKANVSINGIGHSGSGKSRGKVLITLLSCHSSFSISVETLIMNKITGPIPNSPINTLEWIHLDNLNLADPTFSIPGPIDILLGADISDDILTHGKITGPEGYPAARNTHLGWIVSGRVSRQPCIQLMSHISTCDIDETLKRFWEIEDLSTETHLSKEEQACEDHFLDTHCRDESGRYVTSLPFKSHNIGLSKSIALRRLHQVERRLIKNPDHRSQYEDFIQKYLDLGHMEIIPLQERMERVNETNYLPHHFVVKESSTTTTFRVVFDASAKTSNGVSLNNNLMVGPTVQDDMYNILLRFRLHKYAFTADIVKMYRQVKVTQADSDFLRILWRKDITLPPDEYRLLTVTYGTASAPFTATRTLHQIANDDGHDFPLAAPIVKRDFYVDDLMSGCDNIDNALLIQSELIQLLDQCGFSLRKWSTNDARLIESIPESFRETSVPVSISSEDSVKALGLIWNTRTDSFSFQVNLPQSTPKVTKRIILSETAKLYDPLGWVSPVLINAKIILQQLWSAGLQWDEEVPIAICDNWVSFRHQLFNIEKIVIPRLITLIYAKYQLHGFGDASERAYAAVVYLRSELPCGSIKVQLISSKTKVAPIKQISIPKLELCGAALVSKLMKKVSSGLHIEYEKKMAWTDSTITLGWISGTPNKWKTFVANRVSTIQEVIPPQNWRHVPGIENPADLASRGITPNQLNQSSLWWNGPTWLSHPEIHWPTVDHYHQNTSEELRTIRPVILHTRIQLDIMERFSSLTSLVRVTARIMRFITRMKKINQSYESMLCTLELKEALTLWIKRVQESEFTDILKSLQNNTPCSKLAPLSLFLDNTGIIRVGGRLRNSSVSSDMKHPILLPKKNHLTTLIITHEHFKLLHGGSQLMMSSLSQQYWIISARTRIRQHVRECVTCIRNRATTMSQIMGDLPRERVQPSRPFLKSGVDFGGPFQLKTMKGRGGKTVKSYICLFVCLSTKAIHLELVSDLSSEAFIAAFRRMTARRGRCSDLFSDNGTNFVGANSELKKLMKQALSESTVNKMVNEGTQWHFIPPSAPHFGGIWEAGIKSTKFHLKRVLGNLVLTFEEMTTVLSQVEACLNSRPLCPQSNDPDDLAILTPGHFLIGDAMTSIPEPTLTDVPINRCSRWQLAQQATQHFWNRWRKEYLTSLQQRAKWNKSKQNIEVGDLVLIKEDDIPPTKWPIGRVVEVHPGSDKCIRVASVKTFSGVKRRAIVKLVLLLNDKD